MSVFLRWGVFGILAVAALVYSYNANKKGAEVRAARAQAAAPAGEVAANAPASPECEKEYAVAALAVAARNDNEPLDRLLRRSEIAWESAPIMKERLTQIAIHWYQRPEIPADVRAAAISDCVRNGPVAGGSSPPPAVSPSP
jgi:hypothetical protein